ncbi:DUF6886 family protein [Clostridium estertheticum]|uniref:Uncharacterized protein n=1 Tax=Clostridium estertheticum TaxID=238834 RepID=A0A7Y3SZA5_9CLOT|nr:DUF6886 family protein [Clostridium estertheticum]NNU78140.1 hypothetical protein [Clostridium estertheticum]WBL47749.1 hypothetical protein LOR37_03400 [Clostridium estertheticum]
MRLFHISEESNIKVFEPRIPLRADIDNTKGLVWSINEKCLPNFLTPRNCPRVTYYSTDKSSKEDNEKYFPSESSQHIVAIEHKWFETMKNTVLYLYEFDISKFYLQDEIAGYYVSEVRQVPINKIIKANLFNELSIRNVEIRIVDNLWDLSDEIKQTSLNWSMCRMAYAQERQKKD